MQDLEDSDRLVGEKTCWIKILFAWLLRFWRMSLEHGKKVPIENKNLQYISYILELKIGKNVIVFKA